MEPYVVVMDRKGKAIYVDEEIAPYISSERGIFEALKGQVEGNLVIGGQNYHFLKRRMGGSDLHLIKLYPLEDAFVRVFSTLIHEFKNPLGALRALTQALETKLRSSPGGEGMRSYTERMIREIDRLNALLASFKFLSRPKTKLTLEFDLASVIRDVVELYREQFSQSGIGLRVFGERRCLYRGDPDEFHQIVANLLKNAREAIHGSGDAEVGVYRDGKKVIIEVRDTGEGIEEEVLRKIEQGIFVTTKETGMGMGLYVVNRLLRRYNASLVLKRRPEGGTVAQVILP